MSRRKGTPFWEWSLTVYEIAGVKNRLIYLQDDFGFDVNVTLWCCWRAVEGEFLGENRMRAALVACESWQDGVIEPLREARRNAHGGPPEIYARLKELELDAEHREQDILYGLSNPSAPIETEALPAAAMGNLKLYASLLDAPRREGFSSALLRDLIDHIFPEG